MHTRPPGTQCPIPCVLEREREGTVKPVKVYVEYESDSYATARQIVGRLKDAPETGGWREER